MSLTEPLRVNVQEFLSSNIPWQPFRTGIEIHCLYGEVGVTAAAALLRYAPGAQLPSHEHVGLEHILVLRGAQRDERGTYGAGTLVVNPPGSQHSVDSPDGCVVLVIWQEPVRFT
jgi:anti-sigma factor ChrR (cupin superfamily)